VVFDNSYQGPTYSVKYLGIIDGSMGVLSRKMAMQPSQPSLVSLSPRTQPQQPNPFPRRANSISPVLGQKYTVRPAP
jgi:hypothetical protein